MQLQIWFAFSRQKVSSRNSLTENNEVKKRNYQLLTIPPLTSEDNYIKTQACSLHALLANSAALINHASLMAKLLILQIHLSNKNNKFNKEDLFKLK